MNVKIPKSDSVVLKMPSVVIYLHTFCVNVKTAMKGMAKSYVQVC